MGVYIDGMEMPTSCWDCEVGNAKQMDNASCPFYSMEYWEQENYQDKIADGCPLLPVPPHGRLGDLDAAVEKLKKLRQFHADDSRSAPFIVAGISQCIDILSGWEAPTIIPADKEGEE